MKTDTPETDQCFARSGMMLANQVDELDSTCRKLERERNEIAALYQKMQRERDGMERAYYAAIRQMNEAIARAEWLRTDANPSRFHPPTNRHCQTKSIGYNSADEGKI